MRLSSAYSLIPNLTKEIAQQAIKRTMTTVPIITSADAVGQDVPRSDLLIHPSLDIPLTPPELVKTELLKDVSTNQIALSLMSGMSDRLEDEATQIMKCAESVHLSRTGRVKTYSRCKRRLCPLCSSILANKWKKKVTVATDHLSDILIDDDTDNDQSLHKSVGLKLTLNAGQACPINDLKLIIRQVLHNQWSRLLQTKIIKDHIVGSLRATEITIDRKTDVHDGVPLANPHIHAIILLRPPEGLSRSQITNWLEEVSNSASMYWRGSVRKRLRKLGIEDRIVTAAAQLIEPLSSHTSKDFTEWSHYIVKGAVHNLALDLHREDHEGTEFRSISNIWIEVERAIKGIRLISTSGDIADAMKDAEEEIKRSAPPHNHEDDENMITHKWSFTKERYIDTDHWKQEIDKPRNFRVQLLLSSYHLNRRYKPPSDRAQHPPPEGKKQPPPEHEYSQISLL